MVVLGVCQANPVILFSLGAERDGSDYPLLILPGGAQIRLEDIVLRCKPGRGNDLRVFDLDKRSCETLPTPKVGNGRQPALDQPLSGGAMTGQPVQMALDVGQLVWYNLITRRACIVGACSGSPGSQQNVSIDFFFASPSIISYGKSTTLFWTTTAATLCELSSAPGGLSLPVQAYGKTVQSPKGTTVFTLTCQGNNGPAERDVTVTVVPPDKIFANGFE